jgi:flagellar basal-body rod protein FlgC
VSGPLGTGAIDLSASGITADRLWMDVIAENLANMDSVAAPGGGPYRRQEVVLAPAPAEPLAFGEALSGAIRASGVEVAAVIGDPSPFPLKYDPGAPGANAQGYVAMPNVNEVTEMTDLAAASQSYNANATALGVEVQADQTALSVAQKA